MSNNDISPNASISDSVTLGSANKVSDGVTLHGSLTVGDNNYFAPGVRIGGSSRQRIRDHHETKLTDIGRIVIGSNNLFFENCVVHMPIKALTVVGDRVSVGAHTHIAHDCEIGNDVVISVGVGLGGYCILGDAANIGIGVTIHPRTVVGSFAMLGAGSVVVNHVRPAATVIGNPARFLKPNLIGLNRANVDEEMKLCLTEYLAGREARKADEFLSLIKSFESDIQKWDRQRKAI